jgi:dTDP-4-dehydrorhamnose reductase
MKRILITGASGLLGANLVLDAVGLMETAAVAYAHRVELPGVQAFQADLADPGAAEEILRRVRPDWVVHCAAATDVDACEVDPATAFRLNREMAGLVAEAAAQVDARLAHISTDAVFDGTTGGYGEDDPPNPVNVYGRSKLEGEAAAREACPEALIVRTNIFGWNALDKKSLAEWFLSHLETPRRCPGFVDVSVTPILVSDLGRIIFRMLEAGLRGVYHVVGADCVSKFEFGVRIAQTFGLDAGMIDPVEVESVRLRAPRARRLCLRGAKIDRDLATRLPSLGDGLARFKAEREAGRPARLRAMAGAPAMEIRRT